MSASDITAIKQRCVYVYGGAPAVDLSRVASSGNLSSMNDTRKSAGAYSTRVDRFPTEGETAEPGTVTVTYDRINSTTDSVSGITDTDSRLYPVFNNSGSIQAMTATDMFDTFVSDAIDLLIDGNDRDGTYRIHTATSLANHTLISGTPVFSDTRANTGAYTAGGIPETLDQPTTITNYYLMRTNQGTSYGTPSITEPLYIRSDNDLQIYTSGSFDTILQNEMRYHTANTVGSRITYSINGTGNNRGSAMVNTILNGGGNYQTRFVNANDYRAQEFPNGTAVTANTYYLRITRS
jgi:hypothetical protein